MESLQAEIRGVLTHEMESRGLGQRKLAQGLGVGVGVVNDLFNLKRPPTEAEVARLDVALKRGGTWIKRYKDATRKPRKARAGGDLRSARFYSLSDYAKRKVKP